MLNGPNYDAFSRNKKDKILVNKTPCLYYSTIHRQRHRSKKGKLRKNIRRAIEKEILKVNVVYSF